MRLLFNEEGHSHRIALGNEFFWAWVAEERRVHPDELALSLDDIYDFFATYCATDGI